MSLSLSDLKERFSRIKLIVSDIDGTLVTNSNEISPLTVELVKKLRTKNVLFSMASQRVHSSIVPLAKELDIDIPYISLNGTLIQDTEGKVILNKSIIDKKYVERALKLAERHYVKIALCYNDEIVYTEDNSVIRDFMTRLGTTYTLVKSYDNYMDNVLEIIMSGNDRKIMKHIQSKMRPPFGMFLKVKYYRSQTFQGVFNVEVIRKGISKKTGLRMLTKYLNIRKEEVMVFGDWYNDRDLFQFGATNIALENAVDELKEMADYVTKKSNDDDGVAEVLKMLYDTIK
ncbi:MAG TPA: Cof-type HAD-IIB family hydrolase [Ignavibacteria bacterium]|nr:Cof-type HAD-IIB family hydrolase [Ignavibacteria bacterium]